MDDRRFLRDPAMRQTDIAARIAPSLVNWPTDSPYVHWSALRATVTEARSRLTAYFDAKDEITQDPRLTAAGKAEATRKAASKALAGFAGSKAPTRAHESVGRMQEKWSLQVQAAVKPAANEAEAALHAEIRRHVAGLKGGPRLAFLEKHASDPRVAASMLEAPKFLTNLTDGEELMIRNLIEASVLPPEIAQAKIAVTKARGEAEHGWERAQALIAEDAGLRRAPDGSWAQPEEAKAAADAA